MPEFYTKPTVWCMMLHQPVWEYFDDDAAYCTACKVGFHYPTKKNEYPVYLKK